MCLTAATISVFISFEHDFADRGIKAADDRNRTVSYFYDHGGRLVKIQGLRSTRKYVYEDTYLFSIEEDGRRIIEFDYDEKGRVKRLTLPDRRSYRFRYEYQGDEVIRSFVTKPDGTVSKYDIHS